MAASTRADSLYTGIRTESTGRAGYEELGRTGSVRVWEGAAATWIVGRWEPTTNLPAKRPTGLLVGTEALALRQGREPRR